MDTTFVATKKPNSVQLDFEKFSIKIEEHRIVVTSMTGDVMEAVMSSEGMVAIIKMVRS